MSSADALAAADATALAAGTKTTEQLIIGLPELASADEAERLPATAHLAAGGPADGAARTSTCAARSTTAHAAAYSAAPSVGDGRGGR